jgi:hypothetical protein
MGSDSRQSLTRIVVPTRVDLLTRVESPDDVRSPVSGRSAAFVHVEVVEQLSGVSAHEASLGSVIFGDLLTLSIEGEKVLMVDIVVRRATFRPIRPRVGSPLVHIPSELVPVVSRSRGGTLAHYEHLVMHGNRLRLHAIVESADPPGRAGSPRLIVRNDLAPVVLDEVLEDPRTHIPAW